jgi:uncharacterized protein
MIWIKIFFPVLVMSLMIARNIKLEIVLPVGAVILGLLFGLDVSTVTIDWLNSFISSKFRDLFIIIMSVMILGELMEKGKLFNRMSALFLKIFKDNRIAAAASAAFIGFLPMPGGSLISAPFVEKLLPDHENHEKMAVNYWYRHIWEYFFPLYAGLAWIITVLNASPLTILTVMGPMTLIMALWGIPILLKKKKREIPELATSENPFKLLVISWPIIMAVILSIVFKVPLPLAVLVSLTAFVVKERKLTKHILPFILRKKTVYLIFLVSGMVFFDSITRSSGVAGELYETMRGNGSEIFIIAVPMICGLLTGITIGFVSISFPILSPFLVVDNVAQIDLILLAYTAGFCGVLISPMHLCLIITTDFYKTTLGKVYPFLIKATAGTFITALVYYFIVSR